jgi:hypothetical protein
MKASGPLVTLGTVAALGAGIFLANVGQETEPTAPGNPVAESPTTTTAASAQATAAPPPADLPAKADYVGKIPTSSGAITLEISATARRQSPTPATATWWRLGSRAAPLRAA